MDSECQKLIKRPEKILIVDETITSIIVKRQVQGLKIEDEETAKAYLIKRTPVKRGLQMVGT